MQKSWFTLIELLISLVIIGVLSILLVEVYQTMISIWVRVEHEKIIQTELLFAMQTVQNLVDKNTIVIWWSYWSTTNQLVLSWVWWVTTLVLDGSDCQSTILTWTVHNCNLQLKTNDGQTINLFNTNKIKLSHTFFKPIPDKAFTLQDETKDEIATTYTHQWIRRFGTISIARYNPQSRSFKSSMPFQTFFNSKF